MGKKLQTDVSKQHLDTLETLTVDMARLGWRMRALAAQNYVFGLAFALDERARWQEDTAEILRMAVERLRANEGKIA